MMPEQPRPAKNDTSNDALQWHPSLNVYILESRDILLLSAAQQLLLPAAQFPFLSTIDGTQSADKIHLKNNTNNPQKAALFYQQIYQLKELNLLLKGSTHEPYIRPLFDAVNMDNNSNYLQDAIPCINLSAMPSNFTRAIESILTASLKMVANHAENDRPDRRLFHIILVDDFLDPRIIPSSQCKPFMVIKISGDNIWLSAIFNPKEELMFTRLQQQILDNQPVRKWLLTRRPETVHSYAFAKNKVLTEQQHHDLSEIIYAQILASTLRVNDNTGAPHLVIYDTKTDTSERHPINTHLNTAHDFSAQINAPIRLERCISHFNSDGGSRSIAAEVTINRLLPLVSPITGIINLLDVHEATRNKATKIYRTGFFKSPGNASCHSFDQDGFVQICLGKGVSHEQSKASALSEAIERYCALYQADVPSLISTQSALSHRSKRSFNYHSLVPYSECQYQNFNDSQHRDSKLKQAAIAYDDSEIHWLPSWSLTHNESVYLPLSQCFSNIPFDEQKFGRWHSNGCAAGNTLEEAILQALFELIERDAAAIWWYNRIPRPQFDLQRLDKDNLAKLTSTLSTSSNQGYDFWVLDLTNDLGIPVMAGIGKDKVTGGLVMGFGCHINPKMAAQRALTELCQLIPIRDQNAAPFDFDAIVDDAYLYPKDSAINKPSPPLDTYHSNNDIRQDILHIVANLKRLGMETLAVDYSRAYIPLNAAKVFAPGLCHIWPQLSNDRLYRVPVSLGWLDKENTEGSLNQQALYI